MTETFIKKNLRLSLDFDTYLVRHKRDFAKIPNGATVVLTVKGDEKFNRSSMEMAKEASGRRAKFVEACKEGKRWVIRPIDRKSR